MRLFEVVFGYFEALIESWMCGEASLDVDKIGWRSRFGLARNLGPLQYDWNNFKRCKWKCLYFWGVLGVLMGAPGVANMRCCLPGCGWDWIERHIGPGYEFRAEAIRFEPLKKMLGKMRLFLGCFGSFWDSDGGLLGYRCAMWPPWMWMISNEAVDLVWGGI